MDIKHFVLQQWVERDLIRLKLINMSNNYSDVLTKATGRTLFHRHSKILPAYITDNNAHNKKNVQKSIKHSKIMPG